LSADLYNKARALEIEARCLTSLDNFKQSADQLNRSGVMFGICGLAGGGQGQDIAQGEIYLQKSEYVEARNIYNQIVETLLLSKIPLP
jgi:hypothetical protein